VTVTQLLTELERQTGLCAMMIVGGPEPREGGKILVMTIHSGKTPMGNDFGRAYPAWEQNVQVPYTQFLTKVFRKNLI
jgi:hypothetical protein